MFADLTKTTGAKNRKSLIIWSLIWAAVISAIMYAGLLYFPNNVLGNSLQLIHLEERKQELLALKQKHVEAQVIPKKAETYRHMKDLLKNTESAILEMEAKMVTLEEEKSKIGQDFITLQEEYKTYYKATQSKLWARMEGQSVHRIELKDGTLVDDVTIRDFSKEGIRVKKGYAYRTISVDELSENTKKRYLLCVSDLELFMQERGDLNFKMD